MNNTTNNRAAKTIQSYTDYRERVKQERNDLNEKLVLLLDFSFTEAFHKQVDNEEQIRILHQIRIMEHYLKILDERIANFKE